MNADRNSDKTCISSSSRDEVNGVTPKFSYFWNSNDFSL